MTDGAIRPLNVPLLCWHESTCSARTDPLVALAQDAGFIATDRPVPVGTPVFLELALGHASNAARAQIDGVVVSGDAPVEMAGFVVRFVDVDSAVLTWIERHLQSAAQKKAAAAPPPSSPSAPLPAAAREPPPFEPAVAEPAPAPPAAAAQAASRREASLPRRLPPPLNAPLADDAWGMPPSTAASPFASRPPATSPRPPPPAAAREALPPPPGARVIAGLEELEELPEVADFAEIEDVEPTSPPLSPPLLAEPTGASAPAAVMLPSEVRFEPDPARTTTEGPFDAPGEATAPEAAAAGFSFDADDETAPPEAAAVGFSFDADDEAALSEAALSEAAEQEPPLPSLDLQVAEALGDLPELADLPEGDELAAMDDAFGSSFAPWGEAPAGAPSAPEDPFALDLPDVGESLELAERDDPPAPPAPSLAPDAAAGAHSWDAIPLPPAADALAPPAADDGFDPFADADAEPVLPEAAAPLVSDQFADKADADPADDLDVDVFDDGGDPQQLAPPPPLKPRDDLPGLADAGVGFSNPFARAARGLAAADADDDGAARGFPAAPGGPAPSPSAETMPWGLDRAGVIAAEGAASAPGTDAESVTPTFGTRQEPLAAPAAASWAPAHDASPASFGSTAPYPLAAGPPHPAAQQAPGGAATTFPDTERYSLAPGGPALRSPAPALDEPPEASEQRTPTLEFPQPGPPSSPVPPPSHTPTLREFAAVNPPAAGSPASAPLSVAPLAMPAVSGFEEDDVVEVSTTSQIVRAGEGGLSALLAKDKAARFDMPVQSVTGGPGTLTVESEAFREPSRELDPFSTFRGGAGSAQAPGQPLPPQPSTSPAPLPATAAQPAVWFPGAPQRAPDEGPPTGVFGPGGRPAEAWQVPPPSYAPQPSAPSEPDELPLVTGITVLEDAGEDELPLVQALPLEEEAPPTAPEPWVVGGPGRDPER